MDILTNLIPGYNVYIIELLVPIIGTSMVFIFIMIYGVLIIKTKERIYITVALALLLLLLYNIILFIIKNILFHFRLLRIILSTKLTN